MSTKRKFISENWQSFVWTIAGIVFTFGFLYSNLEAKVDGTQATKIAQTEIARSSYSKSDGKVLASKIDGISRMLEIMNKKLDKLSYERH